MCSKPILWESDSEGRIKASFEFGDSELVTVNMVFETIELVFEFQNEGSISRAVIECDQPAYFYLESDHLQNVVEGVYLLKPNQRCSCFFDPVKNDFVDNLMLKYSDQKFLIVTPTTGIELLVACNGIRLLT
jgi:hypothetical protein